MIFKCHNCGLTREEDQTKMVVRDGIRYTTADGKDYLDECPKCLSRCEAASTKEGLATRRGGVDSGNGGKSNAR